MFEELKDLKKDMAQTEKDEREKQEKELKEDKEKKLKTDFVSFMKQSGIKKI
jgi:hypothetical protein